jgi:hypothetical protein
MRQVGSGPPSKASPIGRKSMGARTRGAGSEPGGKEVLGTAGNGRLS